jgi:DNA helicase TIP49 (TBP-interacting protein)
MSYLVINSAKEKTISNIIKSKSEPIGIVLKNNLFLSFFNTLQNEKFLRYSFILLISSKIYCVSRTYIICSTAQKISNFQ